MTERPDSGRRLWRLHTKTSVEHGIPVLFVEGRLGHDAAAELEGALLAHTSKVSHSLPGTECDTSTIVIDLSNVDYVSGAALKVFKSIADRQSESGGRVRLRAPSEAARFALELSGLLGLVD